MKVILYAREGDKSHRGIWHNYFAEGLKKHNIKYEFSYPGELKDGDIAVIWNIRERKIFDHQEKIGGQTLVFERGFTGLRSEWTMAGYNNLNGRADFCNKNMPDDRWKKYWRDSMKPWNPSGHYVLIAGQINGDASLHGVNIEKWVREVKAVYDVKGIKYKYRPHPGHGVVFQKDHPDLDKDIKNAYCVITYSSAVGIESILAGKPTITEDCGSMVWDITTHNRFDFYMKEPNRRQWGNNFAYTQWNKDDMISGECWEHLKGGPNGCFL